MKYLLNNNIYVTKYWSLYAHSRMQIAPPVLHYKISVGCVLLLSDLNIRATHWTELMIFFIGIRRSRSGILFSIKL